MKIQTMLRAFTLAALITGVGACNKTEEQPETQPAPMPEQSAPPVIDTTAHMDTLKPAGDTAVLMQNSKVDSMTKTTSGGTTTTTKSTTTTSTSKNGTKTSTKKTTTKTTEKKKDTKEDNKGTTIRPPKDEEKPTQIRPPKDR